MGSQTSTPTTTSRCRATRPSPPCPFEEEAVDIDAERGRLSVGRRRKHLELQPYGINRNRLGPRIVLLRGRHKSMLEEEGRDPVGGRRLLAEPLVEEIQPLQQI